MNCVITGVTSFLGLHTARLLLRHGWQVIGVVRPGSRNQDRLSEEGIIGDPGFHLLHMDFDNVQSAERLREDGKQAGSLFFSSFEKIDGWIHFAWDGIGSEGRSNEAIQRLNIENAKKAYVMAEASGCHRFLFAGSQAEYGVGSHERPMPVSAYGKAKLEFGQWGLSQGSHSGIMKFLHMRIFSVYGHGDHEGSLVNSVVRSLIAGKALLLGPCTQLWNYMECRDLARAVATLLESGQDLESIYDIAGKETRPLREYVEEMFNILRDEGGLALWSQDDVDHPASELLRFGARGNNAEGAADMSPDTRALLALGFQEDISFQDGILSLFREWKDKGNC